MKDDQIVATVEEATQAERSPNTFIILITSLSVLVVIGAAMLWYFFGR